MKPDQLLQLATKFEKQAQALVSAQPGDIQNALSHARLWEMAPNVSPLLDTAGIPDNASVNVSLVVSPGGAVGYNVVVDPPAPGPTTKLSSLLKQKFGPLMSQAIKSSKLTISSPMTLNWLKF